MRLASILVEPLGPAAALASRSTASLSLAIFSEQLIAIGFGDGDELPRFLQIRFGLCQIDLARIFASDEVGNPLIGLLKVCLQRGVRAVLFVDLSAQVVQECVFAFDLAAQRADSCFADRSSAATHSNFP